MSNANNVPHSIDQIIIIIVLHAMVKHKIYMFVIGVLSVFLCFLWGDSLHKNLLIYYPGIVVLINLIFLVSFISMIKSEWRT